MFIHIGNLKNIIITVILITLIIVSVFLIANIATLKFNLDEENNITIGAKIHNQVEILADKEINNPKEKEVEQQRSNEKKKNINGAMETNGESAYELNERFQRPSKLPAVKLKYNFIPKDEEQVPPYIAEGFEEVYQSPEDVIHAYYAILKNAANMFGYDGGCGTISWMDTPYPYAYELFSDDTKENICLNDFIDSFIGTGAINLLHLEPAFQPMDTPDNIKYYFVEIEALKGHKEKRGGKTFKNQPNYFEYYYGIITAEYDEKEGWKIKSVDYLPEVYLCHPLHGWDYYYDWIIEIIYNQWYGMNLKTDSIEMENNYLKVYASNENNQYRLDFIRLANGDDVLLHEYIKENDKWKEVSILNSEDESWYKININRFSNKLR